MTCLQHPVMFDLGIMSMGWHDSQQLLRDGDASNGEVSHDKRKTNELHVEV